MKLTHAIDLVKIQKYSQLTKSMRRTNYRDLKPFLDPNKLAQTQNIY